jgi:sugar/nucleoside kinase (ribokinase family)
MSTPPRYVTGGGLRVDYLIARDGRAYTGLVGGNAVYAAVGAALWSEGTAVWARLGENYPADWPAQLNAYGVGTAGLKRLPGRQEHRTFFAYSEDGRRHDTNPAAHFARIGRPLPPALLGYVHSTIGQDDAGVYEPLALRPGDWPAVYSGCPAVHLSPLSICTHRDVPPFLRRQGVRQITADPGERYMVPELLPHVRRILPNLDAFLPSAQEVRSLLGADVDLRQAAETFAAWGAPLVVIKNGANGILLYERENGRATLLPAYHAPGDKRVVDVTGAGDAFCGGFMVGLAQTPNAHKAAHGAAQGAAQRAACLGLISASLVIEGYGALYALSRDKAEAGHRLAEYLKRCPGDSF